MNSSRTDFVTNGTEPSGSSLDYGKLPHLSVDFLLATTAAAANSLLLLTIYKDPHRSLRSPSTNLVINMAVADFTEGFLAGYFLLAYDALQFIDKSKYTDWSNILVRIFVNIGIASMIVGCCNVVAMAYDRWFAVTSALNYRNIVTAKRVNALIVVFWIYAIFFTSLLFIRVPLNVFDLLLCHLHVSLPLLVLPVVYWKTFRALKSHAQRMKKVGSGSERTNLKTAQREKKTTKAFVIILCLFYVAFIPYVVAVNLRNLCSVCAASKSNVFLQISFRFLLLNCSLDPFVYAWRIPKYRRAVRSILNKYCCSRRRNNAIDPAAEITGTNLDEHIGQESTICNTKETRT